MASIFHESGLMPIGARLKFFTILALTLPRWYNIYKTYQTDGRRRLR